MSKSSAPFTQSYFVLWASWKNWSGAFKSASLHSYSLPVPPRRPMTFLSHATSQIARKRHRRGVGWGGVEADDASRVASGRQAVVKRGGRARGAARCQGGIRSNVGNGCSRAIYVEPLPHRPGLTRRRAIKCAMVKPWLSGSRGRRPGGSTISNHPFGDC